nr:MAG TPA: hypothetical protein [Caudoviricetes sp.]
MNALLPERLCAVSFRNGYRARDRRYYRRDA